MPENAPQQDPNIPGTVNLSEDVIAEIARKEVSSTDGVEAVEEGFVRGMIDRVRGDRHAGIHIDIGEGEVAFGITITARYGMNIPDLANAVRAKVIKAVEEMTGYRVRAVNIYVDKLAPLPGK